MKDFLYEELSNCCTASIIGPDICSECGEHCGVVKHEKEITVVDYQLALREVRNEISRVFHNLEDSMDFENVEKRKEWTQDAIGGLKFQYDRIAKLIHNK